jgi:Family of unknown function (DUF6226)
MEDDEAPHHDTTERPYGRVTNAARFAVLHSAALELLDRLAVEYDVERIAPYENDDDLGWLARIPLARSTVALVPRDDECAPLVVAFSSFPGLLVRAGRRYRGAFPGCGCDACDETAEGEIDRFLRLVQALTTGRFREYLQTGADGSQGLVWEWGSDDQYQREWQLLQPEHTSSQELTSIPRWKPWTAR